MTKENTIIAFLLSQTGIIIVRNMSSTDLRRQNRWMRRVTATVVMTERITAITTMVITSNGPGENKAKQGLQK